MPSFYTFTVSVNASESKRKAPAPDNEDSAPRSPRKMPKFTRLPPMSPLPAPAPQNSEAGSKTLRSLNLSALMR